MRPLPRRHVPEERRALRVVGVEAFEAGGLELELARLGLQTAAVALSVVGRQRRDVRGVLSPTLPHTSGRPPGRGALVEAAAPRSSPSSSGAATRCAAAGPSPRTVAGTSSSSLMPSPYIAPRSSARPGSRKIRIVRARFAERLDAGVLQHDHAMVALREGVRHVARAVGELPDVPALEAGAGRQDDVGEPGLALHPDRLVHHALEGRRAIHGRVAVGVARRAELRSAVAIVQTRR